MWNTGKFNSVKKLFYNFIPRIVFLCFVKHGGKNEKLLKEFKFTYLYYKCKNKDFDEIKKQNQNIKTQI